MAFCSHCGNKLEENSKFCPVCGTRMEEVSKEESFSDNPVTEVLDPVYEVNSAPAPKKASGELNIGMLVWAIINLVACCTPLGIAGLICTILAKDAPSAEDEAKKLKTAKTCNLIGTIGGAVVVVLYVILVAVVGMSEYMYYI